MLPNIPRWRSTRKALTLLLLWTPLAIQDAFAGGITTTGGQRVLLRGVGWSPWYPKTYWSRPQAVQDRELELLRQAHVNALRTWGPVPAAGAQTWADRGMCLVTQVSQGWCGQVPHTQFADGSDHRFPSFVDPRAAAAFCKSCRDYVTTTGDAPNVVLSLLGNEFSWVGRNRSGNYVYAGFDEVTLAGFRHHLRRRFGTLQHLNSLCGGKFASWDAVQPPGNGALRYEWWLFLRDGFEKCMKAGHDEIHRLAPRLRTSYAKLMARWDPCCEDAGLSFLDVGGQNLYWHWEKDWAAYVFHLKELIRHAGGRPVVITESGFRTVLDRDEERRAGRRMKQMLWNCFLQPEVAGVFPFVFNDEWWRDGDPSTQSKSETWGVVTALREPKATYHAMAEVYGDLERLEPMLVGAQAAPQVAVTCQDLDWAYAPKGEKRTLAVVRALLSSGVPFQVVYADDLLSLDPKVTPRLILCDTVLARQPNGSGDAAVALRHFVERGGQVLYLSASPWRMQYGPPSPPADWRSGDEGEFVWRHGRGAIEWRSAMDLTDERAGAILTPWLQDRAPERPVRQVSVSPVANRSQVFVFPFRVHDLWMVGVVNEGESPLASVELSLAPELNPRLGAITVNDGGIEQTDDGIRLLDLDVATVLVLSAR